MLPHDPDTLVHCLRETLVHAPAEGIALARLGGDACWATQAEIVQGVVGVAAGAALDILNLPCWNLLLERIGPDAMRSLLSSNTLFWPLQNGCLVQASAVLSASNSAQCTGAHQLSHTCSPAAHGQPTNSS